MSDSFCRTYRHLVEGGHLDEALGHAIQKTCSQREILKVMAEMKGDTVDYDQSDLSMKGNTVYYDQFDLSMKGNTVHYDRSDLSMKGDTVYYDKSDLSMKDFTCTHLSLTNI